MELIFQNGHAPCAQKGEEIWYLPFFGAYHPKKKEKIRAVFDSSAKFEGLSLNSVLLSGPDLTNNLVGILMRFREHSVGIMGDIEQMFYQFYVHEKDRNFLRFLWYKDNDMNKELIDYRMCVHMFGNSPSPAVNSFSSKNKDNTPCKGWHVCRSYKTVESHKQARDFIIKQYQKITYNHEFRCLMEGKPLPRDSSILILSPFLDENGIMRVGGRLKKVKVPFAEKQPVLIPRQSHLATLLVRHYHEAVCHQGRHFTEGAVRNAGFWIIGGKRLINFVIHKCVKYRRLRGKLCYQRMSDLPTDRMTPAPPFSFVGVDVFGPWDIVTRRTRGGAACSKRWAVIFVCQTTRAIHLELVEEMTSSSFINATRRFFAIRGKVQEFRSDRGTNFVGATDDLKFGSISVEDGPVGQLLYKFGTVWRFNPPHVSHMGGSWERLIGVSSRVLDSVLLENKTLKRTHEVLSTFMAKVMAIVNSRPLVPVSTDVDAPFILTPAILLTQKTGNVLEAFNYIDIKEAYRHQWKQVQYLSGVFWNRWRREYIQTLQLRPKWNNETCNIQTDDIVLLRDKKVVRNEWPLGLVSHVFPSEDDLVRKIEIRVIVNEKPVYYIRPITEIVKLL